MKVVVDTNVLVSGIFFGGVPGRILAAWRDGKLTLVVSPPVLDEYHRVGALLRTRYEAADLEPVLALIAVHAEVVEAPTLSERLCDDPDDDKFMTCALAGGATIVVSGDRGLRRVSGWNGIEVMMPRAYVDRYLRSS
jgi:putative PIN family toxin of toxin-antitoxin system